MDGTKPGIDSAHLAQGTTIGRYRIERRIGAGGGGVVYLAIDGDNGARVALKTLRQVTADQMTALKNEFRSMQGLYHANLVQLGELFEHDGAWFLSMEYVDGVEFLDYVRDPRGGFFEAKLRGALRQLAAGVAALHAKHVVHRDLKPSNVLVAHDGRVAILDFGLALRDGRARDRDEAIVGTVLYMAPEQVTLETAVGPAADWYAVGAMLFRALTGAPPFEGSGREVLERKVIEEARSPRAVASALPADLVTLCEQLVRLDPRERPTDDDMLVRLGIRSIHPPPVGEREIPLLGRRDEIERLQSAFDATRAGHAVAAVLLGESGVGKSLLLHAFAEQLAGEHPALLQLTSRCYERESVPFKAFDGVAEGLVGVLERTDAAALAPWLSDHAGLLPRIFPELGVVTALNERAARSVVEDPAEARRSGFEALRQLLRGLASSRPVLLAIDDLQWADADSLALLHSLLEPPNAPPLLCVCTYRIGSDLSVRATEDALKLPGEVRTIHLEKLRPSEASRFVDQLLAHENMPALGEEEIAALVRETGGHPMFLTELLLHQDEGEGVGAQRRRLDDVLRSRVSRLPASSRRLLECVCVAGVPVDERLAAEVASLDGEELLGTLPRLCADRLLKTSSFDGDVRVEPYHDRIRESVLGGLAPERLRSEHGKLALALERSGDAAPEALAEHWIKAGSSERARGYVLRAAERSAATLAFDRAAALYAQAIELTDAPAERDALHVRRAEALTNANRWREAAELRLALAAKAAPLDARRLRTLAAEQLLCSGKFDEGAAILERVLREVRVFVPASPLATIVALLAARLVLALRGVRFRLRDGELPAQEAGRIDPLIAAGYGFSMTDTILGSYFNTRSLLRALAAGDRLRLVRTLGVEASLAATAGKKGLARTAMLLARMEALVNEVEMPLGRALLEVARGYRHHFLLEWAPAKEHLLRAERIFGEQCVGQFWAQSSTRTMAFRAIVQLGDRDELAERVPRALREMEQVGDLYGSANLKSGPLAWLRLVDDQIDDAEEDLAGVAELLPQRRFVLQSYFHWLASVQVDLYRDRPGAALDRVERSWTPLRRSLLLRLSTIRVLAWELRGRAALAAARDARGTARDERLHAVDEAAASLEKEGYACADGFASLLRAGAHTLRGCAEDAARAAGVAEGAFDRLAMKPHAAAARLVRASNVGGNEGAACESKARQDLDAIGARDAVRFARALAPTVEHAARSIEPAR